MTWYDMIRWWHFAIISLFSESIDLCHKWDNISVEGTTQLRSHCSFYGSPPHLSWHLSSMTHTLLFSISVESMHCMSQNSLSLLDSLYCSPIPIPYSLLFSFQIIPTLLFSNFNILSHTDSPYCSHVKLLLLFCSPFQISSVLLIHPIVPLFWPFLLFFLPLFSPSIWNYQKPI